MVIEEKKCEEISPFYCFAYGPTQREVHFGVKLTCDEKDSKTFESYLKANIQLNNFFKGIGEKGLEVLTQKEKEAVRKFLLAQIERFR